MHPSFYPAEVITPMHRSQISSCTVVVHPPARIEWLAVLPPRENPTKRFHRPMNRVVHTHLNNIPCSSCHSVLLMGNCNDPQAAVDHAHAIRGNRTAATCRAGSNVGKVAASAIDTKDRLAKKFWDASGFKRSTVVAPLLDVALHIE